MIVGLTGGIACGKSTVANMFKGLGSVIIDADIVAREVVEPGEKGLHQIVQRFGKEMLDDDGRLDRKALGQIIFDDERARADLNAILHPLIRERMYEKEREAVRLHPPLIIKDIPLLFESKLEKTTEAVIVVYIPSSLQLQRLIHRDGLTEVEARKRIASQMSIETKKKLADYVIDNSGTTEDTFEQVNSLFDKLSKD